MQNLQLSNSLKRISSFSQLPPTPLSFLPTPPPLALEWMSKVRTAKPVLNYAACACSSPSFLLRDDMRAQQWWASERFSWAILLMKKSGRLTMLFHEEKLCVHTHGLCFTIHHCVWIPERRKFNLSSVLTQERSRSPVFQQLPFHPVPFDPTTWPHSSTIISYAGLRRAT